MSLLNVPSTPFPLVFSPSTTTPTPLTGIRLNPCATPLSGGPSGHLADPTPNTGYEPKICIDVASTRRSTFRPEIWVSSNSTTRQSPLSMTSIYLNITEHHAAASTQQQVQFPLCWNLVHSGLASWICRRILILLQVGLASRKHLRTWLAKQLFQVFFESVSKEKRDEDQNVVQTLKDRQNLYKFLERKADLAVRGEKLVQQRSYEAEADVEVKHWEIALHEINQEFWIPTITATKGESMGWSGLKG